MDVDFGDIWGEHGDEQVVGVELECDVEGDSIMGESEMGDAEEDEYDEEENDASFEWGLTDGESESMTSSEAGDITLGNEAAGVAAANGTWRRHGSAYRSVQLMVIALLLFSAASGG